MNGWGTAGTQVEGQAFIQPMSHCAGCSGNRWTAPYEIDCQACASRDDWCVARYCVTCIAPCVKCGAAPNPVDCGICFSCMLIWCPWCSSTCCTQWIQTLLSMRPLPGPLSKQCASDSCCPTNRAEEGVMRWMALSSTPLSLSPLVRRTR